MILEEGTHFVRPILQVPQLSVEQPTRVFYLTTLTSATILNTQVLSVKQVADTERFRIVVTDGVTTTYAMIASQINDVVSSGLIKAYTVICVEEFITSVMNNLK